MTNYPDNCPHCNTLLDDGDIVEKFISMGYDEEKAVDAAENYGWTQDNKQRFSRIVYVKEYDSKWNKKKPYYMCPDCKKEIILLTN